MARSTLAEEIRQKLGELSPAERKVARVLLAAYPSAGFETVAVLAGRASVSAPTVVRFVNRLGYRGFPDFQASLRSELDERNASPLSLYTTPGHGREPEAQEVTPDQVLGPAVTRTLAELPPHDLERAVQLLADPKRRITLFGGRFTHLLAEYLGLHLMQLRDDVRLVPGRDVERTAVLATLGRRDVLVVFDYRRYEADKLTVAQVAQECGASVVLFTDAWLSPVAQYAEVVLASQVIVPSPYDSYVPTLAVVETLISRVLSALGEDGRRHLQAAEEAAERAGLYDR
ncbi:MurR/RpiR family transcriptional regulator [Kitasatospora sp. McL0602]|uniref:MurR/RpiR family transcriptional regulator n=1 Tax=Kitasatospora sp. McL0602 TaxID=3439530 RepID=UPI003F8B8A5E